MSNSSVVSARWVSKKSDGCIDTRHKPDQVDLTSLRPSRSGNKRSREANGAFRPALTVTTREVGEGVEVRVRDNGVGIPPEDYDKLFQPFFTTKPTGEGTGLGLSISYEIITQQHGGTITVDSEVDDFTEFTVRLPRSRHAVAK
jgi:light-regulated signal transduction histidine kinase (bacteriophytochrome)